MNGDASFFEQLINNYDTMWNWLEIFINILYDLFFHPIGWIILLFLFLIFVFISHTLSFDEAWKGGNKYKIFLTFLDSIKRAGIWFAANFIFILAFLLIIFTSKMVMDKVKDIYEYFDLQEEIENLEIAINNLSEEYKVATMDVLDVYTSDSSLRLPTGRLFPEGTTVAKLYFKFYSPTGEFAFDQGVLLPGTEIHLDFVNLNFEYSKIKQGEENNLGIPMAVFSQNMSPDEAIPFKIYSEEGYPLMFAPEINTIYGLEDNEYIRALQEISKFIKDANYAKVNGVRDISGQDIWTVVKAGERYSYWVLNTGGMMLRKN